MRILGIDPGLAQTGWGVIEVKNQRFSKIESGVIRTNTGVAVEERIHAIANAIGEVAQLQNVTLIAMEDIFFARNVSSAITVAKVIGAIIQQLSSQGLFIRLFTPLQIKLAVTGYGNAEKNQVQEMVRLLLKLESLPRPDHVADSLAAAICLAHNLSSENRLRR
ncbi:MAG: crossover junction endodeoxyribonuclease RuvC [Sphaerochaetaceae bacterium]